MTSICKKIALAKYYHPKHLHFLSVPLFKKVLEALQITKKFTWTQMLNSRYIFHEFSI